MLGASDGVRPDVAADAERPCRHRVLADADAEKLADRAPDVPEQDASFRGHSRVRLAAEPGAVAELCKRDAVQFAARSCAEQEVEAVPE